MKALGIFLAFILSFILLCVSCPYYSDLTSNEIILFITESLNGLFCSIVSAYIGKSFYEWFISKIKKD